MSGGFEVGVFAPLRAYHRLPWMEGPEGDPHAHTYRVEVRLERSGLDERGMVCDIDVLAAALTDALGRIEGRDLDEIKPADAEAVTVEILAGWLHEQLREPLRRSGAQELSVRVWESADAFGGFRGAVA